MNLLDLLIKADLSQDVMIGPDFVLPYIFRTKYAISYYKIDRILDKNNIILSPSVVRASYKVFVGLKHVSANHINGLSIPSILGFFYKNKADAKLLLKNLLLMDGIMEDLDNLNIFLTEKHKTSLQCIYTSSFTVEEKINDTFSFK